MISCFINEIFNPQLEFKLFVYHSACDVRVTRQKGLHFKIAHTVEIHEGYQSLVTLSTKDAYLTVESAANLNDLIDKIVTTNRLP